VAEQRYQAVMAVIVDGLSISQVAEKVGVSRQTLHSYVLGGDVNRDVNLIETAEWLRALTGPRQLVHASESRSSLSTSDSGRGFWGQVVQRGIAAVAVFVFRSLITTLAQRGCGLPVSVQGALR
jgi:hypothetical protein